MNFGRWLKDTLNRQLHSSGYRLRKLTDCTVFEDLLYRQLKQNPAFRFVQIGANDGVSFDPVFEFVTRNGVEGLVVEPLSDCFAKLEHNYRDYPRIAARNVAIHRGQKRISLYRVDPNYPGELPDWAIGIASVNPNHFKLGGGIPEPAIVEEQVPAVTLQDLFDQAGYSDVDLLQVDTEGYDYEILKMLGESQIRPVIVRFEHGLSQGAMDDSQFAECFALLRRAGYFVLMEKFDAIAVKPELLPG